MEIPHLSRCSTSQKPDVLFVQGSLVIGTYRALVITPRFCLSCLSSILIVVVVVNILVAWLLARTRKTPKQGRTMKEFLAHLFAVARSSMCVQGTYVIFFCNLDIGGDDGGR
ncbi:uncharacterized protein K489DRAFT_13954 [Dissoconium aciculare CBS 342.82]|uniref:Uncharacterized protein n=1 Tax=Dissoconium aciculare CBS 342.82 TaxID=1314786 RepID=A0A6J3MHE7_9PEZI|nr:uncharacterized protein K489DRAFT_13954 [Dissoconium aciculare CBS 342.82]KAF1827365.1 hypothetical protein K489DRAFT_13954 [Dissoconium aciculare CBS 342.82]